MTLLVPQMLMLRCLSLCSVQAPSLRSLAERGISDLCYSASVSCAHDPTSFNEHPQSQMESVSGRDKTVITPQTDPATTLLGVDQLNTFLARVVHTHATVTLPAQACICKAH